MDCSSLTSIDLGHGVTSIKEHAFAGCTSLTSVEIPGSVSTLGPSVFKSCSSLTSVTFSVGLTSFGEKLFEKCVNLSDISYLGTVEEWNAIQKGRGWNEDIPATLVTCSNGNVSL